MNELEEKILLLMREMEDITRELLEKGMNIPEILKDEEFRERQKEFIILLGRLPVEEWMKVTDEFLLRFFKLRF